MLRSELERRADNDVRLSKRHEYEVDVHDCEVKFYLHRSSSYKNCSNGFFSKFRDIDRCRESVALEYQSCLESAMNKYKK